MQKYEQSILKDEKFVETSKIHSVAIFDIATLQFLQLPVINFLFLRHFDLKIHLSLKITILFH